MTMNPTKTTLHFGPATRLLLTAATACLTPWLLGGCADLDDPDGDAALDATRQICFSSVTPGDAFTRTATGTDEAWSGMARDAVNGDSLPVYGRTLPWTDTTVGAQTCTADGALTRGTFITSQDLQSFCVSARLTHTEDQLKKYIFRNETNNRPSEDGSAWQYASQRHYYWPGASCTVDFYAVAPAEAVTADDAPVIYPDEDNRDAFSYTTPASPDGQIDLMGAQRTDVAGDYNTAVALQFSHLCAAVEFEVGNAGVFDGTIQSVRLVGIADNATYRYTDGWSTPTGNATYTLSPQEGNKFGDPQRLILLPQTLTANAQLQIDYILAGTSDTRTFTYSLQGHTWEAGVRYRYSINIAPDMSITFAKTDLDSHYVTTTATITLTGIQSDCAWTITAAGSSLDDAARDVSLQLEADVNSFVKKDGYWTANSRGTSTLSGTGPGTYEVRIFAPENATTEDRTFTFTLKTGDTTLATNTELTQHHPYWTDNGYGWEVGDDNQIGRYGLTRTKRSVYIIPYDIKELLNTYANDALAYLQTLIEEYDASSYVTAGSDVKYTYYTYEGLIGLIPVEHDRYYFTIDYSKIPLDLTGIESSTDGWTNTKNMNSLGVVEDICPFEAAVQNTYKVENGHETENLYRVPNESDEEATPRGLIEDESLEKSGILSYVLKKNAYTLESKTTTTNGITSTTRSVKLIKLKWYLPAKDQDKYPDGEDLSAYWSSTSGSDNQSYLLGGTLESREEKHNIRAIRNKE
jgi:hypothetical protein